MKLSISARLALWYGTSLMFLLSLFVVFLYTSFHLDLHRDFDQQFMADVSRLESAVTIENGRPVLLEGDAISSVAYRTTGAAGTYVRILSASDEVVYRSPNFDEGATLDPALSMDRRPGDVSHTWMNMPTRTRYSSLESSTGARIGWLEVTRFESTMHRELHRLRWMLALGIVLATAVAIGIGYGMAKRALRPVAAITGAAREIGPDEPGRRLPTEFSVRDELTDLAETLNELLGRLDDSLDRERRFREDAAHEMFTPISAIQSEIDVALHRPREEEYYRETLATLGGHVKRISSLVESLLVLSQAEGASGRADENTDLSRLARQEVTRFDGVASDRSISIRADLQPGVAARIEPDRFALVVENLLDNAVKYTRPGGTVTVSTWTDSNAAVLSVRDTGIGFSSSDAEKLFDRFYRAGGREVRRTRGSGLGLSIVKAIIDASGGRIDASSPGPGGGSTFEVRLPVAVD